MATKGFEKQTYTQVPNSLFEIMKDMDECELKVVLYICRYTFGYHREEYKISTRKLADAIGMNTASVAKGAEAAVARGLIEKITDGQNTTIWRAVVSDSKNESPDSDSNSEPEISKVIQKVNQLDSDNESQVGVKERTKDKSLKKGDLLDGILAYQKPEEKPVLDEFERSLGFGALPWHSNTSWEKFRRFVVRVSASDPGIWKDYAAWRQDGGKYKAFSNRKIRENPAAFMDTGYPEYEASKMYRQSAPVVLSDAELAARKAYAREQLLGGQA